MALDLSTPFVWGSGGAQLTPAQIDAQRKVAQAMLAKGGDYSPVQSWSQGAARVAQAVFGGLMAHDADQAAKANQDADTKLLASLLPGMGTAPASSSISTAPAVTPSQPAASPSQPMATIPNDSNATPGTVGMDTRLADRVQDFIQDNPGTALSSGVRSTADQARLYADRANNPNPVAPPGTSLHERGMAADISGMTPDQRAMLSQYGLSQPVANDPVHVQLANDPAALPANSQPTQGFAVPGATTPAATVNPALARAIASPYTSEGTKKILTLMLTQQMQAAQKANDPLRNLQIQEAQGKVAPLSAPYKDADGNLVQSDAFGKITLLNPADKTPNSVGEYNFYAKQEADAGRTPLPYGQWDVTRRRSGATNVNTGTIPKGYEQFQDPLTGALSMRPIPGGPADTSKQDKAKTEAQDTASNVITNAARLARDAISSPGLSATGTVSRATSAIGETNAAELRRQIDVLKANASIETLNQMRQQSKTGGALGSVTEGEERLLANKLGAIDPTAPREKVIAAINDYERTLLRTVHGREAGDKIYAGAHPAAAAPPDDTIAVNPKTGERLIRKNGKWVPLS